MSTEYFIQHTHNIHFSKQPLELSPKLTISWSTKQSLSKYKKIEIIPCILSDHNAIKLELNNKTTAENTQMIGS
jgi:hypothetical protein